MSSAKFTAEDLKMMQAWSLDKKIRVSLTRIIEFGQRWGGKSLCHFQVEKIQPYCLI